MEELKEGDGCFAHVKSYPWWPARITEKEWKKSTLFYSVVFYGTDQTAKLPAVKVIAVTNDLLNKFRPKLI